MLDGLDLIDQIVGGFDVRIASFGRGLHVRPLAIKQVQVSHGVVVIGTQGHRFFQTLHPAVDRGSIFRLELGGQRRRHRVRIFNCFLGSLVVILAHLVIAAKRERPVNHADPVIWFGIFGLQRDVFLVVGLRFFHLGGVKRRATHVVKNRTDAIDRRKIIRVVLENRHEFRLGLVAIANIFR